MRDDLEFKELFTRLITFYELAPDVAGELLEEILKSLFLSVDKD